MRDILKLISDNDIIVLKRDIKRYDDFVNRVYPPVILEEKLNIKRISKRYNLPFTLSSKYLEALAYNFMDDESVTNVIFDELLRLNPELIIFKDVPFYEDDHFKKCSVIGGAASRMNSDDISDFITSQGYIEELPCDDHGYIFSRNNNVDEYNTLYNKVYGYSGNIGYFPSIKTLKYILSQIENNMESNKNVQLSVVDVIKQIPQQGQVQYDLQRQLSELRIAANKLGLYDAADFLRPKGE